MKKVISLFLALCFIFTVTACGNNSKNNDVISGRKWVGKDQSLMDLKENGDFIWYQSKDNLEGNYMSGTYVVYKGQKAMDYIANDLSRFGVTMEEQQQMVNASENRTLDTYYCLVITNTLLVMDGVETTGESFSYYMGFYYEDGKTLDFVNMGTANYATFTLQE